MKDMIGIKIPNGSNLGARLKTLAKARRMQYWELLSGWLDLSESGLDEAHQNLAPVEASREKEKEDELEARILHLENWIYGVVRGSPGRKISTAQTKIRAICSFLEWGHPLLGEKM